MAHKSPVILNDDINKKKARSDDAESIPSTRVSITPNQPKFELMQKVRLGRDKNILKERQKTPPSVIRYKKMVNEIEETLNQIVDSRQEEIIKASAPGVLPRFNSEDHAKEYLRSHGYEVIENTALIQDRFFTSLTQAFNILFGFGDTTENSLTPEGLLTPSYLCNAGFTNLWRFPTYVVVVGKNKESEDFAGLFIETNLILIRYFKALNLDEEPEEVRLPIILGDIESILNTLLHEFNHRCSYRTGRMIFSGKYRNYIKWLHEGQTEFRTVTRLVESGFQIENISYVPEVRVVDLIAQLTGSEIFNHAYFFGDFTDMANEVDRKLGAGAFEKLIDQPGVAEAQGFLEQKLKEKGIPYVLWGGDAKTLGKNVPGMKV